MAGFSQNYHPMIPPKTGADAFVVLRPNGAPQEPERLVEGVLFGSGRHLFLVPGGQVPTTPFDRTLIAWNVSRESARALAEAMPYLYQAKATTVVVIDEEHPAEFQALIGLDAVNHLQHHGIDARLHRVRNRTPDVALIEEAERLEVDLMVMCGYGHSQLREMLLGGVTYDLLHQASVPLVIARQIREEHAGIISRAVPYCDTTNRLPGKRLGDGARCGNCHRPLFEGKPWLLNDPTRFARHPTQRHPPAHRFW